MYMYMQMYMYTYMYIYVYICICIYMYTYMYIYLYVHTHIYTQRRECSQHNYCIIFPWVIIKAITIIVHCNTLRPPTIYCNTLFWLSGTVETQRLYMQTVLLSQCNPLQPTAKLCNSLQHTATNCNALQSNATHYNTLQHAATRCNTLQRTATHCDTLWHTATHCDTLRLTATRCNTLQRTDTRGLSKIKSWICRLSCCYTLQHCDCAWRPVGQTNVLWAGPKTINSLLHSLFHN